MAQTGYGRSSKIGGGVTGFDNRDITYDAMITAVATIPSGVAGTAGATGAMAMPTGHGFANSDVVSVSGTFGVNYGGVVSGAGTNTITVSGGTGDTLPVTGAVVVAEVIEMDVAVNGDNIRLLHVGGDIATQFTLEDAGGIELAKATVASGGFQWDYGNGYDNPIAGDSIIKANIYNRGTTAGTMTVMIGYDND